LKRGIASEHSARRGARAHGYHPFRGGHLVVNPLDRARHFVGDGSRDNHAVGLAGRKAHDLHSEPADVKARAADRHKLNRAAGKPHGLRPYRIGPDPVYRGVQLGIYEPLLRLWIKTIENTIIHNEILSAKIPPLRLKYNRKISTRNNAPLS
jgi:hypothetical protein